VSVGAAIYPQDGQTIESLLSTADVPLYAMKATRGAAGKAAAAPVGRKAI
jgi:predicted signal transduction protein with EAL and GGDEF domain